jgi:hypothetical protein
MDKPNDGGPAFPSDRFSELGMSLRDYFAGQALAGILADPERHGFNELHAECEFTIAEDAYILADAMIIWREKERA